MTSFRCSYFLCAKNTKTSNLKRFHFPVADSERCQKWIANSGATELLKLSPSKLKRCFICGDHFEKKFIFSKKLARTAVPIKYDFREGETVVYEPKSPLVNKRETENVKPSFSTGILPKPHISPNEDIFLMDITKDKEKLQDNFKIVDIESIKQEYSSEDLQQEVLDIKPSPEFGILHQEISNLKRKTEEQEQTIRELKLLNENLAKDLHNERHRNLYLKNEINLLKKEKADEESQRKLLMNGVSSSSNHIVLIVTNDDEDKSSEEQ